jgi:hypothetical protein
MSGHLGGTRGTRWLLLLPLLLAVFLQHGVRCGTDTDPAAAMSGQSASPAHHVAIPAVPAAAAAGVPAPEIGPLSIGHAVVELVTDHVPPAPLGAEHVAAVCAALLVGGAVLLLRRVRRYRGGGAAPRRRPPAEPAGPRPTPPPSPSLSRLCVLRI